jgi:hypothetical protein
MRGVHCSWVDLLAIQQALANGQRGDQAALERMRCVDKSTVAQWKGACEVVDAIKPKVLISKLSHAQPCHAYEIARAYRKVEKDAALWTPEIKDELADWVERTDAEELTVAQLREALKEEMRRRFAEGADDAALPELTQVHEADFEEFLPTLPDESVPLIFTDPPYDEESIPLYAKLAEQAARILVPGGSLIAYAGHHALPQLLPEMSRHLRYWWILSLTHHGPAARLPGKWVFVGWKPVLWFVKGGRRCKTYVADVLPTAPPDKVLHDHAKLHSWEQGLTEAEYVVRQLTTAGEWVLDPMCGSGTTVLAAARLGRLGIGVEKDPARARVARKRLQDAFPQSAEQAS